MLNKVHHVTYVVESVSDMAAYMEKSFGLKQWPPNNGSLLHRMREWPLFKLQMLLSRNSFFPGQ